MLNIFHLNLSFILFVELLSLFLLCACPFLRAGFVVTHIFVAFLRHECAEYGDFGRINGLLVRANLNIDKSLTNSSRCTGAKSLRKGKRAPFET